MGISDVKKYAYKKLKEDAEYTNEKQNTYASWDTDVYKGKTSHEVTSKIN